MFTALLILAALVVLVAIIGVAAQICGGGFTAVFHLFNNSLGILVEVLFGIIGAIVKANE